MLWGGSPTNRLSCGGLTTHPGENPFVTKLIRESSRTAQHGNGPQPAPDQRVRINLRRRTRIATWNVQTLLRPGAATLLSRELCRYNISLAGLCEVRWHGNGETTAGDHCYFWSGPERRTGLYGVALAIPKGPPQVPHQLVTPERQITVGPLSSPTWQDDSNRCYAPTDVADEDAKDAFLTNSIRLLAKLHHTTSPSSSPMPMPLCLAVIGPLTHLSATIFADRSTNDNGNRLLLLCHHNNLCVADTWFPRKLIHHWTWYSPDGRTRKASDHILISRRWKSFVTNCRVYRGAELGNTDHRLLVAQLKLSCEPTSTSRLSPRLDSSLLSDPNIAKDFCCAIRRTFDNLPLTRWTTGRPSRKCHPISSQCLRMLSIFLEKALDIGEDTQYHRPSAWGPAPRWPDGVSATEPPA